MKQSASAGPVYGNLDPVIAVSNLTKRYGERVALDDVSFRVDRGDIVGILGPNGAGK